LANQNLDNEIVGTNDDFEVLVEVEYERDQSGEIDELEEYLSELREQIEENSEEEEEEQESEEEEEDKYFLILQFRKRQFFCRFFKQSKKTRVNARSHVFQTHIKRESKRITTDKQTHHEK
jgi:DNA-binding Lrp family transcriptional regulator